MQQLIPRPCLRRSSVSALGASLSDQKWCDENSLFSKHVILCYFNRLQATFQWVHHFWNFGLNWIDLNKVWGEKSFGPRFARNASCRRCGAERPTLEERAKEDNSDMLINGLSKEDQWFYDCQNVVKIFNGSKKWYLILYLIFWYHCCQVNPNYGKFILDYLLLCLVFHRLEELWHCDDHHAISSQRVPSMRGCAHLAWCTCHWNWCALGPRRGSFERHDMF